MNLGNTLSLLALDQAAVLAGGPLDVDRADRKAGGGWRWGRGRGRGEGKGGGGGRKFTNSEKELL